jgi:hypothetical protein
MKAIGSYIFAGGFTIGVKKHFDIEAHLEGDGYGADTFSLNYPEIPVFVGPEVKVQMHGKLILVLVVGTMYFLYFIK